METNALNSFTKVNTQSRTTSQTNHKWRWHIITNHEDIVAQAISYYFDLFNSNVSNQFFEQVICKKVHTSQARQQLVKPLEIDELRQAFFQIDDESCPVPDGFNSKVSKTHWEDMNKLFYRLCKELWVQGSS